MTASTTAPLRPLWTDCLDLDLAVVDVETTGLDPRRDRIVQVAVSTVDRDGTVRDEWSTLVDPQRDPGPVHIHGITTERLAGAPRFADVEARLAELLRGRLLVAHNASFDWRMIAAETRRASGAVRAERRMCTMALARRLELDLPDLRLASLAAHCGVVQRRWHDAHDDVRVLVEVLAALLPQARALGALLPLAACAAAADAPYPDAAPRVRSPWADPGPWDRSGPLVQGAKFVITGPTRSPRAHLYDRALLAGLVPMNSVSGRTRFVLSNEAGPPTGKLGAAAAHGVPVIDEGLFLELLDRVRPGAPAPAPAAVRRQVRSGPLAGARVLVLGGPHERAALVRAEAEARGATVAVNLTRSVTHVVELDGAEADRRCATAADLPRLDPASLAPAAEATSAAPPAGSAPPRLRRGEVIDLPGESERVEAFITWPADAAGRTPELDVVALVTDAHDRVLSDEHFAFFNNPATPRGEVELTADTAGEARAVLDLDELAGAGGRVVLAAATTGGTRFGDVGPVELLLTDAGGAPIARGVCDAATTEQSLLVAEVYRRGGRWRIRSIGQGYDDGLRELAVRYGVDVE